MSKPHYSVSSMAEINAQPLNGFNVVSLFSGCGGSSLGYRMARYKVLLAVEFIEEARDTYRSNFKSTKIDPRNIRDIKASEILDLIGLKKGELDVLDGSPPCSSFSMAGKRHKNWGEVKNYSGTKQRTDDLFYEYIRMVNELQPRVFVAENVKGLVAGTAKGVYLEVFEELQKCGYRVQAKLLNGKWLGVPQARERVIFIGVRNDLKRLPVFPKPLPYFYTVRDAISGCINPGEFRPLSGRMRAWWELTPRGGTLDQGRQKVEGGLSCFTHRRLHFDEASPTISANSQDKYHPDEPRTLGINELKRICSFPDDFILTGSFQKQWERCGRAVPPLMMKAVACSLLEVLTGAQKQ